MRLTAYMSDMLDDAVEEMKMLRHEFMMPEHLLLAMAQRHAFCMAMQEFEADADTMRNELNEWLGQQEKVPDDVVIGMRYSTLFLLMTAIIRNFYKAVLQKIDTEKFGLKTSSRIKAFVFKYVSVPAKWVRMARQDVLNMYTDNEAYAHVFNTGFG